MLKTFGLPRLGKPNEFNLPLCNITESYFQFSNNQFSLCWFKCPDWTFKILFGTEVVKGLGWQQWDPSHIFWYLK